MKPGSRRFWILSLALIVGLLVLWFCSSHSTLEIQTQGTDGGLIEYTITKTGGSSKTTSTVSPAISELVAKGNYQVTVSQADKGFFSLVKTKGFLGRSKIIASLATEKQRAYVGDNPAHCMFYTNTLYSYDCGAAFALINQHLPASSSTPTYVQKVPSNTAPEGVIEGLIKTPEGNVALVHQGDVEGPGGHILYLMDSSLKPIKTLPQNNLQINTDYALATYGQGFIIFSSDYSQVYQYSSVSDSPVKLSMPKPKDGKLKAVALTVSGSHITVAYSEATTGSSKVSNEIIDYVSGRSSDTEYTGAAVRTAVFCGQADICAHNTNKTLGVYQAGSAKLHSIIDGVEAMAPISGQILLALPNKTVLFSPDNNTGNVDYTYGSYDFCGLSIIDEDNYLLCMKAGSHTIALKINRSSEDLDMIDKRIQQLQTAPQVNNVSIYQNYIYIVPKSAPIKYDPVLNILAPDPEVQSQTNQKIQNKIDSLKISRDNYKIIITE